MSIRLRYRRYKTRHVAYNWHHLSFREWFNAWGCHAQPGQYGYA